MSVSESYITRLRKDKIPEDGIHLKLTAAARMLNMDPRTLQEILNAHGIKPKVIVRPGRRDLVRYKYTEIIRIIR